MFFKYLVLYICLFNLLSADPWGKDADLACASIQARTPQHKNNLGISISRLIIRFHQEVISPADGPRSHYIPSSSQYTLNAINKYGFFKGWAYGCDRLLRENDDPWVYKEVLTEEGYRLKWNPVP